MTRSPTNKSLTRKIQPIPTFVRDALAARGLMETYKEGSGDQQKRLNQMLDELEGGGVYMKMTWNG